MVILEFSAKDPPALYALVRSCKRLYAVYLRIQRRIDRLAIYHFLGRHFYKAAQLYALSRMLEETYVPEEDMSAKKGPEEVPWRILVELREFHYVNIDNCRRRWQVDAPRLYLDEMPFDGREVDWKRDTYNVEMDEWYRWRIRSALEMIADTDVSDENEEDGDGDGDDDEDDEDDEDEDEEGDGDDSDDSENNEDIEDSEDGDDDTPESP